LAETSSSALDQLAAVPDGRTVRRLARPPSTSQISVCSEISSASSTSMPRYLTVDSSLWTS